jgi:hypothetical protein
MGGGGDGMIAMGELKSRKRNGADLMVLQKKKVGKETGPI